jgi:adenylate cyclase
MSDLSDGLIVDVNATVTKPWSKRDGQVVPESGDLALGNDRVEMEAVFLYADLADSTELAILSPEIGSEVCKAYLRGATKIIRANGGEIRSFDGDRIMGVFVDGAKHTVAVKSGLQINWFFQFALIPQFKNFYADPLKDFTLRQTVGIDSSHVFISRGGIRNNSDLIWVGRAPNIAAKLSAIRHEPYSTLITEKVHSSMLDSSKFSPTDGQDMWMELNWSGGIGYGVPKIYGSSWWWKAGE